jgi:hypothetical protein
MQCELWDVVYDSLSGLTYTVTTADFNFLVAARKAEKLARKILKEGDTLSYGERRVPRILSLIHSGRTDA